MITNDVLDWVWQGGVVAEWKLSSRKLSGRTEKENTWVRVAGKMKNTGPKHFPQISPLFH
jgi:hypothetical protein